MRKRILVLPLAAGLFFIFSALVFAEYGSGKNFQKDKQEKWTRRKQEQKEKNQEFKKSLEGKTPEEKSTAIKAHREGKHQDAESFYEKTHNDHMAAVKEKLAKNNKLNEQEKDELISFYEEQYRENATWRNQQYNRNTDFLEEIASSAKTPEEKKEAVKKHFQEQKAEGKTHWEKQRFEKEAKKKDFGLKYKGKSGKEKAEKGK